MKKNSFIILTILICGCQIGARHETIENSSKNQKPSFFVVTYTPERIVLDSLAKDDPDLEESYSDCSSDINEIIKYSESKQLNVITTNKVKSVVGGITVNFNIEDLCAVALCNQDSAHIIRTPNLEDFLRELSRTKK